MSWMDFINNYGGPILAFLGAGLATILPGIGSAKGVGIVGEAAAGVITEDPDKFGKALILQVIPGTQGFYGFVTTLIILSKIGVLGGGLIKMTVGTGLLFFLAAMPIAIAGWRSAINQAHTAAAGISILAKRPDHSFKAVLFAAMVETYAVIALVTSIIIIVNIPL